MVEAERSNFGDMPTKSRTPVVRASGTHRTELQLTPDFALDGLAEGWGRLHHRSCDKWVSFFNPSEDRVQWYVSSHRCGPPGTDWHVGELTADEHRSESPTATAAWFRAVTHYVDTRPVEVFLDSSVWPAARDLARALNELFLEANASGSRP